MIECKIRELELKYEEVTKDQFPYQRMHFWIYCDGILIDEGYCNIRDMYLYYEQVLDAAALPLQ